MVKKDRSFKEIGWLPLWKAVFIFGVTEDPRPGDAEKTGERLSAAEVIGPQYFSFNELREALRNGSGAYRADIDPDTCGFLFKYSEDDPGYWINHAMPWYWLADDRPVPALTPWDLAEALFDDNATARARDRSRAADVAIKQVCRLIRSNFDIAVACGYVSVYGRPQNITSEFVLLPADTWHLFKITDWEHGVAVLPNGTSYFSVYVGLSTKETSSTDGLKAAPLTEIHAAISAVYDQAEILGEKPPNMRELPVDVLRLLKAKGYVASARFISELCKAPQHARRRRPPGKTVRSERGSQPK